MTRRTRSLVSLLAFPLVTLVAIAHPVAAQSSGMAADSGWTPELSMRFRTVGGTAISPDGKLVAYTVRTAKMKGKESSWNTQIWIAAADGSLNMQYTRGEESSTSPAFSPDGATLAFLSSRGGKEEHAQVWMLPVSGGEAWQLTHAPEAVSSFAFSPDGARIAYTSRDTISAELKKRREEKRDEYVVDADYQYTHLYTVTVAAGDDGEHQTKRLTAGHFTVRSFDWSPDGRSIVFSRLPDPRLNTGMIAGDISVVPSDSGAVQPLVSRPGADGDPLWSPDGRTIAFTSDGGQPEPVGLSDVWVVPAKGGEPRKLANTPDRSASLIAWSVDGRSLYVQETIHTKRGIVILPADGGEPSTLVPEEGVIGNVALAPKAGRMALTWQDPDTPADVYVSPAGSLELEKLSSANADITIPAMGRTELITWKSDDYTIEGLLTYPVGYRKGSTYPLILNVHGGPAGAFTESFTGGPSIYMLQYFAQHGYAILRPNPRGSTGYGKEFRFANVADWGGGDFRDLMTGVDQVLSMGLTSPDSLVEMGWSYGGYMTSWIETHTNRFAATSMGAGLPDLISMSMTTDIPDYLIAHMAGKNPWQDFDLYQKHSGMYAIQNATTPIQILHGANDERVPTFQGYEFYHALKRKGVPTQMVVFPRTPHGPREPKLLMDVSPRILGWFDRWLGRGGEMAAASR